jgi:hypothetical protein
MRGMALDSDMNFGGLGIISPFAILKELLNAFYSISTN